MPGILERLGSFGRSIINTIKNTGRSILEAVHIAKPLAPDITTPAVIQDFATVTRLDQKESLIADLSRSETIPDHLHTQVDIPFKRPFAYTVTVQGRAVAGRVGKDGKKIGGQFTRDEFNITSNRKLTPQEVIDIAYTRFGAAGEYPLVSIRAVSVTAAMNR